MLLGPRGLLPALRHNNFYRIAAPPTNITGAQATWRGSDLAREVEARAVAELKQALTPTPVLATPDFAYPFELSTDASQFAIGVTLLQDQIDGLQPIAYKSFKLNSAECNHPKQELKLLAVVHATWRGPNSALTPNLSTSSTSPLSATCPGDKLVGWRPSNSLTWTSTTRRAVPFSLRGRHLPVEEWEARA